MARAMTPAQILAQMKKWHVPYREYHGWETRGRGPMGDVHGIIIHHTGSDAQSDSYLQFLAVDGRGDLPAPLCNVSTDMDGDLWLIAAARANHAGAGSSAIMRRVIAEDYADTAYKAELKPGEDDLGGTYCNGSYYGNEVRYDGGQPMTTKQWNSAVRWAAAICDFYGWSAQSVIGHREHTLRKPDPGNCPMYKFRLAVSTLLAGGPESGLTPNLPEDDMQFTDPIPGLTDPDGSEVTVGEALKRGNYSYREGPVAGSTMDKRVVILEGRVGPSTAAQAEYAYKAVTEGGVTDTRLDALQTALSGLDSIPSDAAVEQRLTAIEQVLANLRTALGTVE